MNIKRIAEKMRRALLCCGDDGRKHSLEIGSPTDVRRLDVASSMQGLTDKQRALIREKVSADATQIHLFQHQNTIQPALQPTSTSNSPSPSVPSSIATRSNPTSRSPSSTLLNNASTNLPSSLPTPPRHKHAESTLPHSAHKRMQSLWDTTRRLSTSLGSVGGREGGYLGLGRDRDGSGEGLVLLNLDFADGGDKEAVREEGREAQVEMEMEVESPARSGKSTDMSVEGDREGEGGFQHVSVVGGTPNRKQGGRREADNVVEIQLKDEGREEVEVEDESSSDEEGEGEQARLVLAHAGL
ncbi:hypothetical protein P154DRAFT_567337 [Amniculicola lignicola CBS 123094]|uniref:Uncharacterized protein n=1 Tax=Amniculicola lignicola CBS 123094 TaxID=1392246 RepID=A0A6A5VZH2_9PLEO|nr:hypothetical protein P154DRAFT_567337 [Amniculicola lignicola CBS 123094]